MASHNLALYNHVERSNMPTEHKSAIRQAFDRVMHHTSGSNLTRAKAHIAEGGHALRQTGESIFVGGGLGLAHVYIGLDQKKVPLDGVLGVLATGAAVALANEPYSVDLRNAAASCWSVLSFRKSFEFAARKRGKAAGTFNGETSLGFDTVEGEDPLITAARNL
jgi:hypothetical protein